MADLSFDALMKVQEASFRRAGKPMLGSFLPEQALSRDDLEAFLTRKQYAVMATTRPNGKPLASMILFLVWRNAFWLPSTKGAVRLTNLSSQPWASLVITEGEDSNHTAVVVEGPTVTHGGESMSRIFGDGLADVWDRHVTHSHDWVAALIELTPDRLLSFRGLP